MRTKIFLLLALFAVASAPTEAAGPVTHAYLAKRLFQHYPDRYSEAEQQAFLTGTLFPDIRYLGCLKRCETHYNTMTLDDVLTEPSPFLAGVKFHSYVDIRRDEYIIRHRIYRKLSQTLPRKIQHYPFFIKLVEDEIVFKKEEWNAITESLKKTLSDEELWGVEPKDLQKWHNLLASAFLNSPSALLFFFHMSRSPFAVFSAKTIAEWDDIILETADSKEHLDYVEGLLQHFESLLAS